jgi:hypothetical protein
MAFSPPTIREDVRATSALPQPHDDVLLHAYDVGIGGGLGVVVVNEIFITDSIQSM